MGCAGSTALYTTEIKANNVLHAEFQDSLLEKNKDIITFHIKISDVQIRQLKTTELCFLNFTFGKDLNSAQTNSIKSDNPKFEIDCEFELRMTLEELRTNCLKITLMQAKSELSHIPLSCIEVDFFTLAFGPSHHAIKLKINGGRQSIGLLQYNIRFDEICQTQVLVQRLKVMIDSIEDKAVWMNFRCITPDSKVKSTKSHLKIGKYNNSENKTAIDFNFKKSNKTQPKALITSTMENLVNSSIQIMIWRQNRAINKNELKKKAKFYKNSAGVHLNDIQFSVEESEEDEENPSEFNSDSESIQSEENSENDEDSNSESSANEENHNSSAETDNSHDDKMNTENELIGECYITFMKLIQAELNVMNAKDSIILKSSSGSFAFKDLNKSGVLNQTQADPIVIIKEAKMWLYGRLCGSMYIEFQTKKLPFIRQMPIGVLSENGVEFSSTPFLEDTTGMFDRSTLPKQIAEILEYFKEIKKRDLTKGNKNKISLTRAETLIESIMKLLKESDKKSMISFTYANMSTGIKAQEILIDLGIHCINFADFIDVELADNYYEILRLIFNRGELDLAQIGIYTNTANKQSLSKSLIEAKRKLAIKFQYSIEKLNRKAVDFYKRDFVVCAVALGFFRVPEFRSAFLKAITKEPFEEIPEWRGIMFSLDESNKEDESAVNEFFDWNEYLYSRITDNIEKK